MGKGCIIHGQNKSRTLVLADTVIKSIHCQFSKYKQPA